METAIKSFIISVPTVVDVLALTVAVPAPISFVALKPDPPNTSVELPPPAKEERSNT